MTTSRLEAFSDGVFAIAITLLVLDLRLDGAGSLAHQLTAAWPAYLAYAVSFLLIGLIWANHHAMFALIGRADRALLFLNVCLLADVAATPFFASVLSHAIATDQDERLAVAVYGGSLVVGGIFFNAVWQYARFRPHLLVEGVASTEASRIGRRFLLGPACYLVGTLIGLLSAWAGITIFAVLILFYWLPAGSHERGGARPGDEVRPSGPA